MYFLFFGLSEKPKNGRLAVIFQKNLFFLGIVRKYNSWEAFHVLLTFLCDKRLSGYRSSKFSKMTSRNSAKIFDPHFKGVKKIKLVKKKILYIKATLKNILSEFDQNRRWSCNSLVDLKWNWSLILYNIKLKCFIPFHL